METNKPTVKEIAKKAMLLYCKVAKEKQFNKRMELNDEFKRYLSQYNATLDDNYILSVNDQKIGYIQKYSPITGKEFNNWAINLF